MPHIAVLVARLTLGGMWIIAGVAKLASPVDHRQTVEEFNVLRGRPASLLGTILPYVELSLGIFLAAGVATSQAASFSAILLVSYTVAMIVALLQGRQVRCNCFGQSSETYVSWATVARNAGLLVLSLVPLVWSSDYLSLPRLMTFGPLRPSEPALVDLAPVAFVWIALLVGIALASVLWGTLATMARTQGGPADELPETSWMRKRLRLTVTDGQVSTTADQRSG